MQIKERGKRKTDAREGIQFMVGWAVCHADNDTVIIITK